MMTILQIMPLAQALRLAAKKEKQHNFACSSRLYQDIFNRFPKNTAARKGLKSVQNRPAFKGPFAQEHPEDQIQHITKLYNNGALIAESEAGVSLLREFPEAAILHNLMGAIAMALGAFAQAETSSDFDCVMAADVFIYLGDLSKTFQLINVGKKGRASSLFQQSI